MTSVFEKLRFRDGVVWTVGLAVEIKLRFLIPPVQCWQGLYNDIILHFSSSIRFRIFFSLVIHSEERHKFLVIQSLFCFCLFVFLSAVSVPVKVTSNNVFFSTKGATSRSVHLDESLAQISSFISSR